MEYSMRLLFEAVSLLLLLTAAAFVFVRWHENRIMFYPEREHLLTPSQFGLHPEETLIPSGGIGQNIHGWYFAPEKGMATILYMHGNAGNIADRLPVVKGYLESGYGVFIFDYRGFGKSGGSPGRRRFIEDSFAAYRWLVDKKGTAPEDIVLFGQSLGGAAALKLANSEKCRAVVLEGTFYSLRQIARDIYPNFPVWILVSSDLDNAREIRKLQVPLLLLYGGNDDVIPHRHSEMLYREAAGPKELVIMDSAGHTDLFEVEKTRYYVTISRFIEGAAR